MPWVRATLHGKAVLARVNEAGEFAKNQGRVEVRYRATDGKAYRALASNLVVTERELLADDHCAQAAEAAKPGRPRPSKAPAAADVAPGDLPGCQAWTDGACSGNPGPAGLGMVLIDKGVEVEVSEYLGTATNNIAELTAILRALEHVPSDQSLTVWTDSSYSIGVLQKGWKAKANTELVDTIRRRLAERSNTTLRYTPGHAGVRNNERADSLARMAIRMRTSSTKTVAGVERKGAGG